ncbi:hypothetical protein [Streptomyces sp. NRRL S-340]|uniref:hypothetical protein n=1 Tax=Streptomyces sp. NRRL S-340 TaxID=1463901 RepID=UPI0005636868|nr:hypothetical protein [Streptomyces sp. NRRL S-340]
MSRETDTPSSGPSGRGGAAYPSGTPPYGVPAPSDDGAAAGRSATQPEERKTETTLTTRIRINIPGSRPIPPVVVRKTVAEGGEAEQSGSRTEATERSAGTGDRPAVHGTRPGDGSDVTGLAGSAGDGAPRRDDARGDVRPSGGAPAPSGGGSAPSGAESAAPAEEKATSDWFAPRKSPAGKGGQGGGATNGAGLPGGSDAGGAFVNGAGSSRGSGTGSSASGPSGTGPSGAASSGVNGSGGTRPGAASRPGGVVGSMRAPGGASRPGGGKGSALPGATGGPVAPGHGGGTGSFDVTEALAAGPLSGGSRPGGEPRRDDLPFFTGNGQGGQGGPGGPGGPGGFDGAGVPGGPGGPGGSPGPAGPTGGPVTGDGPLLPDGGTPAGVPGTPAAPGAPTAHPGSALPGGGLSDDTAILTPQKPAPEPGAGGHAHRPDNVSGHTVTSGMPVVSPGNGGGSHAGGEADSPFRPVAGGPRTGPSTPPASSEPGRQSTGSPGKSAKAAKAPKKKGRSKVALLGGLVVVAAGVAYGAGLLMNHSDVPKGTTVLGVDVGGGSRDDAVKKLDDAFGKREKQPLKLSVDGKTVSLRPDQAGLQLDTQATASAAARSDYNPVSVIGSLFGNHRVVEPQMPVDEEKLQAALQNAAGGAGSATDGTIRFEPGKAVAVYGKTGKGIDAARSVQAVEQAYRTQVETGTAAPVRVATTTRQPTVSNAEVDRMMKQFAEPAMSAKVTVRADATHGLPMSPQKSLWKFLGVKAVDGKLVEYYDQEKLKQLYGGVFDGVLITRGNGQKTPVTVQDVIAALRPALVSKTNRVGIIDTNPD